MLVQLEPGLTEMTYIKPLTATIAQQACTVKEEKMLLMETATPAPTAQESLP
jgi:hypothetical protein